MQKLLTLAGAVAFALTAATALAQEAAKPKAKAPAAPRTAISIECSKQADAKGLPGTKRPSFRNKCTRAGAKAAKAKKS